MSTIQAITYEDAQSVTASDTVDDPAGPFAGFFTGAGGTVKVRTTRKTDIQITNLPAGVIMPLAIIRVFATPAPPSGVLGMTALPYDKKP